MVEQLRRRAYDCECSLRVAKKEFSRADNLFLTRHGQKRTYSSKSHKNYLDLLLQNPELDLESAQNELRWIQQEAKDVDVDLAVKQRSEGMPLQYILGV